MIRAPISCSVSRQLEPVEELDRPGDRHLRELVDVPLADRDGEHLGLEPRAPALRARAEAHVLLDPLALLRRVGLAVAALEVLDDPLEGEHVRALAAHPVAVPDVDPLAAGAVQEEVLLLVRQLLPRPVEVDLPLVGDRLDDRLVEARAAHRPRDERALADRERRVGDEQVGIDLLLRAEAGAARAGAVRRVEREHARLELGQRDAVLGAREALGERQLLAVRRRRSRRARRRARCAVSIDCASRVRRSGFITSRSTTTSIVCLNFLSSAISSSSRRISPSTLTRVKPSCAELLEDVPVLALAVADDRRVDRELRALRERQDLVDDRLDRLPRDRPPADRAVRPPDARVEQAQVVVDLGHGADRRARVPRRRLLVDRDRRREALDRVHVGLLHHLQELARVRRQRLHVAALPFRVDRVEGERRLPGAGEPGDRDQLVPRQADVMSLRLCSRAP